MNRSKGLDKQPLGELRAAPRKKSLGQATGRNPQGWSPQLPG